MSQSDGPRRTVVDLSVGLFLAALLIYLAVQLIVAVYIPLLIIVVVLLLITIIGRIALWRRDSW